MKKRNLPMVICIALAVLAGCAIAALTPPAKAESQRRLDISVTEKEDGSFSAENLSGGWSFRYSGFSDVTISLVGKPQKLEEALGRGDVTVDELRAWARLDAGNHICFEHCVTDHGLSHFYYRYPEFDLWITDDVYQTPDGKEHLIRSLDIMPLRTEPSFSYCTDGEFPYDLDREDWGITLEAAEITPTAMTLRCTQSGGQQLGKLEMVSYSLYAGEGTEPLEVNEIGKFDGQFLPQDGTEEFSIDWAGDYGALPNGNYVFQLRVRDVYDKSQVHPLVEKFHDMQSYYVKFTVS